MKKAPHIREYRGAHTRAGLTKPRKLNRGRSFFKPKKVLKRLQRYD
jgi:hypothetical protein